MATVSLSNIKKRYPNGFQAIHGIDLEIADGEFIVMVGPSGCGKSTLLRMIAGLESITEGEMKIDQTRVNDLEPGQRDIAMVFQNYALYPHMSVFDNMAYGLRNRKVPAAEIEQKVKSTSEILELAHLLDRKPNQLSGGQRQRVAMGRAIVRNPKVFLFDEPLSNLDAKLRVQMRIEIRRLQRELGTTSVYVTHDQVEAMTLADRLVVMNEGLPEQIGTPLELYDRPASTFVAGFLGSPAMNFLPAKPGESAVTLPDGTLLSKVDGKAEGDFLLGVRPEHMQLCAADAADFTLKVDVVEPLGADTIVYGRMEGMKEELVTRLNGKVKVSEGDQLPLLLDREHLHMFNPDSSKRIG